MCEELNGLRQSAAGRGDGMRPVRISGKVPMVFVRAALSGVDAGDGRAGAAELAETGAGAAAAGAGNSEAVVCGAERRDSLILILQTAAGIPIPRRKKN